MGHREGSAVQALLDSSPFPQSAPAIWSAEAGQHSRAWVDAMDLVRSEISATHLARIDTGRLTGWVHPDALADRRDVIADWFSWLFVFDDQCDEGAAGREPALLAGTVRAVEAALGSSRTDAGPRTATAPRTDAGPLPAAMADICARIRPAAPAAWWQRFSWHVREYLHACLREAANRARGHTPAPAEYPRARREGGAILPCLDLAEFATGDYLDDRLYWLPGYQEAREAAADVICWTDDLATVAKERARGDVHNLVIVLAEHHDLTWAQATTQTNVLLERRIADYLAAEQALLHPEPPPALPPLAPPPTLEINLRGLRHWMRGHLDWGVETARYKHSPGNPVYVEDLTRPGGRD